MQCVSRTHPSSEWISYAESQQHLWWDIFGQFADRDDTRRRVVHALGNVLTVDFDGEARTLQDLFAPATNAIHINAFPTHTLTTPLPGDGHHGREGGLEGRRLHQLGLRVQRRLQRLG